jgi:hypothetical protein
MAALPAWRGLGHGSCSAHALHCSPRPMVQVYVTAPHGMLPHRSRLSPFSPQKIDEKKAILLGPSRDSVHSRLGRHNRHRHNRLGTQYYLPLSTIRRAATAGSRGGGPYLYCCSFSSAHSVCSLVSPSRSGRPRPRESHICDIYHICISVSRDSLPRTAGCALPHRCCQHHKAPRQHKRNLVSLRARMELPAC